MRTAPHRAGWQSGYAAACKAVDAGSIPTPASKSFNGLALSLSLTFVFFGESTFAIHSGCDAATRFTNFADLVAHVAGRLTFGSMAEEASCFRHAGGALLVGCCLRSQITKLKRKPFESQLVQLFAANFARERVDLLLCRFARLVEARPKFALQQ